MADGSRLSPTLDLSTFTALIEELEIRLGHAASALRTHVPVAGAAIAAWRELVLVAEARLLDERNAALSRRTDARLERVRQLTGLLSACSDALENRHRAPPASVCVRAVARVLGTMPAAL